MKGNLNVYFILFVLLFIYLTNWQAVIALFKGAFFSSTKSAAYIDQWLYELLLRKTGLKFKFKKAVSDKYAAFSLIFPPNTIVFTSKVLDTLNKDELQWISLHEAGHRVFLHGYKLILTSLIFIIIGIFVLLIKNDITINSLILPFLLAPIYQQIIRVFETQTDNYAAQNMDQPEGMITANEKFSSVSKSVIYNNDLLRYLFTPHLSYQQRIKLAENEIARREDN